MTVRERVPKFRCPHCGTRTDSLILASIPDENELKYPDGRVRRRRECVDCGHTFGTTELLAASRKSPRHRPPVVGLPFEDS